ncbi:MAG: type II toxin-antitoxin system Phd/YefM family antitoxin, partial [Cyanobium sp.]
TYVAPCAREATVDNVIPLMLASACAEILQGEVETEIVQSSRVFHTGAKAMERLLLRPQFDGPVWAAPWLEKAGSSMSEVVPSQVAVRDVKSHLSEWLARAQAGEVVEVTSHRQPIARITAVKPAEPISSNQLQQAIDAGLISWSGQNPVIPPPVKLNDGGPLMSDIVIEDRG